MGGIASTLGSIGAALAPKKPNLFRTPPFIGPTATPPPTAPMGPPPDDEQYGESPTGAYDPESTDTPSVPQEMGAQPPKPRFQEANSALQDRLAHPPQMPNVSLGRKIGGALLGSIGGNSPLGAVTQTLGQRLAYGKYPEQLAQYQADVANAETASKAANAEQDRLEKIAETKRKTDQAAATLKETEARTQGMKDASGDALKQRGEEAAVKMVESGATPYSAPPARTHDVAPPEGVPGLAPTQATVPSPPTPPNVVTMAGQQWNVPTKPLATLEEAAVRVLSDNAMTPEQKQAKLAEIQNAHNILHPATQIHGFETDLNGNTTMIVADPSNPAGAQKIPLGNIGKRERPPVINVNSEARKDKTEAVKAYTPALESAERFNVMTKNYEDAVKSHDQQAMLSLLANHLGMTMGLQKGARLTKDIIREAEQSRPWLQGLAAKFDSNGYLSGVNLTPEQMRQMVSLGRERFAEDISKARSLAQYQGITDDGPGRTPNKATINHYVALANGDAAKAKELAAADGWSIR